MRYTVVEVSGEVEIFASLKDLFGYVEHLYLDRDKGQITQSSLSGSLNKAMEHDGSIELFDFSEVYSTHNSRCNSDWYVKVKKHKPKANK